VSKRSNKVVSKRSNKIELAAVNRVTEAFYHSQRLDPYIPTHDKEPVWDGNIYILHGNKGYSKIPSQVKGKCVKKLPTNPKFPITVVNLENYKRDGGVAYFVVFIIDNEKHPYYHLGMTRQGVYKLICRGDLVAAKLSSRLTLIKCDSIDKMLYGSPYKKRESNEKKLINEY
jgi:hypothetical protein